MKAETVKKPAWQLKFKETENKAVYRPKIPLLIDSDNNVIFGNTWRLFLGIVEEVECIVMPNRILIPKAVEEIEEAIAKEQSKERFMILETELLKTLKKMNENVEHLRLFEPPKDDMLITEENYRDPGGIRIKKEKDKGGDIGEGLFGGLGDG